MDEKLSYYQKNKERCKQYAKEYYYANKEYQRNYLREYNATVYKEKRKEISHDYYLKNKKKVYKKILEWRRNNKERISLLNKKYYKKWKEMIK